MKVTPKIIKAWTGDPLVADPRSQEPPQLHVAVDHPVNYNLTWAEWPDTGSLDCGYWLYAKLGPLRGYWLATFADGGPGPRGSYWPLGSRVNDLEEVTRPVARVYVHDPYDRTSGDRVTHWFLDLDHAMRLCKKIGNTHMAAWGPYAKEGAIEWVPQDIYPTCKWNVGDGMVRACGRQALHPMGGRVLALCSTHKPEHDKIFAVPRLGKGTSRND